MMNMDHAKALGNESQLKKASRLGHIEPFYVVGVITRAMELQAAGVDIVNLAVGEPDFATPHLIVDEAVR